MQFHPLDGTIGTNENDTGSRHDDRHNRDLWNASNVQWQFIQRVQRGHGDLWRATI